MSTTRFGSVLITGANRGIGLAFAKHFVKSNSAVHSNLQTKVIAASRQLSNELESLLDHDNVFYIPLDVTDQNSVTNAANVTTNIVGDEGLNVLVNNAGIMKINKFLRMSPEDLTESFNVNVIGPCSLIKSLQPLLKKAAKANKDLPHSFARAGILNLSAEISSISKTSNTMMAPYKISKAALNMVTKCSAADLLKFDILCTGVHPGWVQTDMGGPKAPLKPEQAAEKLIAFMESVQKDHNGRLFTSDFKEIPF